MPDAKLRTLHHACEQLFAPGLTSRSFVSRGYAFLRTLVPSELVACGVLGNDRNRLKIGFDDHSVRFRQPMNALGKLMAAYPLFRWDPSINGGRPFKRSHFFTKRQFCQLDVYHEVFRPLSIDNHCAVHVPATGDLTLFFGIERQGGPDFSAEELSLLAMGQTHLANAHALARLDAAGSSPVTPEPLCRAGLTPREADTLYWVSQGKSNVETALILGISLHTVKDHLSSIFDKTGNGNRWGAILWASAVCNKDTQLSLDGEIVEVLPPSEVG